MNDKTHPVLDPDRDSVDEVEKPYPLQTVVDAMGPAQFPNTERFALECGHKQIRREGQWKVGDRLGCHFCAGAMGARAHKRNKGQRRHIRRKKDGIQLTPHGRIRPQDRKDLQRALRIFDELAYSVAGLCAAAKVQAYKDMTKAIPRIDESRPDDILLMEQEVRILTGYDATELRRFVDEHDLKKPLVRINDNGHTVRYYAMSEVMKICRRRYVRNKQGEAYRQMKREMEAELKAKREKEAEDAIEREPYQAIDDTLKGGGDLL